MKSFKKITLAAMLMISLGIATQEGYSYSFTPWTTMTGEKTFISYSDFKTVQSPSPAQSAAETYFLYGFTPTVDLIVQAVSLGITDYELNGKQTVKYISSGIMPRIDLGGNNIPALGLFYYKNPIKGGKDSLRIQPQYHFTYDKEKTPFVLELNLGLDYWTESSLNMSNIFAYVSPVYKLIEGKVHLFVEFDPYYNLQGDTGYKGFYLNVLPGLWFGLSNSKYQIVIAGVLNNVIKPADNTSKLGKGFAVSFTANF